MVALHARRCPLGKAGGLDADQLLGGNFDQSRSLGIGALA
jgi:hypothetical protein